MATPINGGITEPFVQPRNLAIAKACARLSHPEYKLALVQKTRNLWFDSHSLNPSPMPATLAELSFPNGIPSLYCPATGRLVLDTEAGIDMDSPQTPHLRFVIDWMGDSYVAPLESVPDDQKAYHLQVIRLLQSDKFKSQNALVNACIKVMPSSAIVFELLDPPQGSYDGEIAYFGFDLALLGEDGERTDITFVSVDDLELD